MTQKQKVIIILSSLAGAALALVLNFFILDKILIPDPCYYHSHDTNKVFDVFYELRSSEGFHPFPTTFNFIFTGVIGALLGKIFSIYKLKMKLKLEDKANLHKKINKNP